MVKQVTNGHAYEYAIATAFNEALECGIEMDNNERVAESAFKRVEPALRDYITQSASDVVRFLIQRDKRLDTAKSIVLLGSSSGQHGDVRDIVIRCSDGQIGISAKHNHYAVKHPRISDSIDFGRLWGSHPVSSRYKATIKPIFDDLRERAKNEENFRDIPSKIQKVYGPILNAFEDELRRLCEDYGKEFISRFFQYMIGRYDFYKAVCDYHAKQSVIESVNINGTLAWGSKWNIPSRIESIKRVRNSSSTLMVIFEGGWQIKFRLHNASSRVEPSLKFDVSFVGMSQKVSRTTIALEDV